MSCRDCDSSVFLIAYSVEFQPRIFYAPINGLPQDGGGEGGGQRTGIRLRKTHLGGDFDIHSGPQGGKFDFTAILKSLLWVPIISFI